MLGTLNITSYGLLVGAFGQLSFFERLFPRVPDYLFLSVLFLPWLTVYTISFCKQAPLGLRPFRYCLLFVMCLYAAVTITAEALYFFSHPISNEHFSITTARVLMYFGLLTFIVFIRACIILRRLETKPDK